MFGTLLTLGLNIMKRFEVCDFLKIDDITLINWLTLIESNYKSSNPYHNSTHASDVLHATAYFLSSERISVKILKIIKKSKNKLFKKIFINKRKFLMIAIK